MSSSSEEDERKREAYEFGKMMRRRHDMKAALAEFDICEDTINRLADGKMTGDLKAAEAIEIIRLEIYREEQRQEYDELEARKLIEQKKYEDRPPADNVPLDSNWGQLIDVNMEQSRIFKEDILNFDTYREDGYFSVNPLIMDKLKISVANSFKGIDERLRQLKLNQEKV